MVEARSLSTIAAPRQKEMNVSATVVATTTFALLEALLAKIDIRRAEAQLPIVGI